ncbi:MAG: Gfo/Idh/MocA family oxidoreductase, partial [Armatimonadota bacterium]|nr:Gfo/Idh/MocA family oxidoreductase [Armatimonadota bacterium]
MSIRVAILGCGSISRGHVQRFLADADVEIVACADPNPAATEAVAAMVGKARGVTPRCFDTPEAALAAGAVEAVGIFTPHTLHFTHAMAALEAGAHVLLEKPMVCAVAHAETLVAKAAAVQRVLAVAYQMRLLPAFQNARRLIRSGALGELRAVAVTLTQDWVERITASGRVWRFNPALSGGGELMDSGSHLLDLMLWASGLEPEEVFAFTD